MLNIQCDRCHSELKEPGALIFSPPTGTSWLVEKYHVCAACWIEVARLLEMTAPPEVKQKGGCP
jgi:hypothetical protein